MVLSGAHEKPIGMDLLFLSTIVVFVIFVVVIGGFEFSAVKNHAEYFLLIDGIKFPLHQVSSRPVCQDHNNDTVNHLAENIHL